LFDVSKSSPLLHVPPGAFARMEFSAVYECLESGHTLANLFSSAAKLRFVFAEMNRLRVSSHPRARPAEEGLRHSIAWMQRHLHRRPSLEELAREAGLSIPYYSALFNRRTGFAPIQYFLRLKIQRACQLLDTTEMRVKEVADEIGCEDAFYFSRLFKKIMGHTPRAYRSIQKG
jgi:AraC-like DNA-binding protein